MSERLPNPSNSDRLKASVKALASLFKHEVNLCQSNHYEREHFIPFEETTEMTDQDQIVLLNKNQLKLWEDE